MDSAIEIKNIFLEKIFSKLSKRGLKERALLQQVIQNEANRSPTCCWNIFEYYLQGIGQFVFVDVAELIEGLNEFSVQGVCEQGFR